MNDRILLVLAAASAEDARDAIESAARQASAAGRLSIGLLLPEGVPDTVAPPESPVASFRVLHGTDLLSSVRDFWQGEPWTLTGSAGMRFDRAWDRGLLKAMDLCRTDTPLGAVLTGCLPADADAIDAVSPVAAAGFTEDGCIRLAPGTPMRYARQPELCAFVHPHFVFAATAFLLEAAGDPRPMTYAAFDRRVELYTLHRPLIRLVDADPLPPLPPPEDPELRSRFSAFHGVDFQEKTLSPRLREGILRSDLSPRVAVPLSVRIQEAVRAVSGRGSALSPLCVTAWISAAGEDTPEQELVRFRRLCSLKNLPLLCYADPASVRRLIPTHPNVMTYHAKYGLPLDVPPDPDSARDYIRLSKPFLLAEARDQFREQTHYLWIDLGYLRYPVYEKAVMDWEVVCGDRIVMAEVDGVPDPSMFSVPEDRLLLLCRAIQEFVAVERTRTGTLPDEITCWQAIIRERPDWFSLLALPHRRELFGLTMPLRGEEW